MTMRRHDLPTSLLALITTLTISTVACSSNASPDTVAAAPSPLVTEVPASAISMADTPTHDVATTPKAPDPNAQQESDVITPPAVSEPDLSAEAERVVQLSMEDLAQRLELALESIRLVSIEAVQWPDTSLGCPEPGMAYAAVITPGFRVVLKAQGKTYEYHADAGQRVVLCLGGLPSYPLIPVKPGQIMDGKPWMPVD